MEECNKAALAESQEGLGKSLGVCRAGIKNRLMNRLVGAEATNKKQLKVTTVWPPFARMKRADWGQRPMADGRRQRESIIFGTGQVAVDCDGNWARVGGRSRSRVANRIQPAEVGGRSALGRGDGVSAREEGAVAKAFAGRSTRQDAGDSSQRRPVVAQQSLSVLESTKGRIVKMRQVQVTGKVNMHIFR
ncbi:unnamed protein product [Protopolystoma xenopodis]|uniref:Uncharacterized protein n=1 Tax=Protopolystoma xenopodis TaxID=117903 RepID=A0A448WUG0_9PLAT|nr:unnamed protein product [Protopolystoma xenopodis]